MATLLLLLFVYQDQVNEVQEHLKVTYRQVQIRVQDNSLTPIKGLKESDFIISINGKKFNPDSFIEVDAYPDETLSAKTAQTPTLAETTNPESDQVAPPSPSKPTVENQNQQAVAIFLDPGMSTPNGFQIMKQTAKNMVDQLPANAEVAVFQMHHSLKNLVLLTRDHELAKNGIDQAVLFADLWSNLETLQQSINIGVRQINDTPQVRHYLLDNPKINDVGTKMAQRNFSSLVHLGELVKAKKQAKDTYTNKVALALDNIGTGLRHSSAERSIFMFTAGGYMDESNLTLIRSITSKLNYENTPIHTVHFRDRDNKALNLVDMNRQGEQEIRDAQIALQLGGLVPKSSSVNALVEDESFLKSSAEAFAGETGGAFVSVFNPLQAAEQLKRARLAAGHYYLISYPTGPSLDKFDAKLTTPNKAYELSFGKSRGSYAAPKPKNSQEKNLDFATGLMYGMVHEDTPIAWNFNYFVNQEGIHVFPILGKITGPFPKGGYKLAMVALNEAGEILDERSTEIRKPGDSGQLSFYDLLVSEKRPAKVRALLQENESGNSNLGEMILPQPTEGANLSTVVLVPSKPSEVFAIHSLAKEQVKLGKNKVARDILDPFLISPEKRIPLAFSPFAKGEPIGLFFHAENLEGKIDSYELESYLEVGEQKQMAPISINRIEDLGTNQATMMAVLDTSQLAPNAYTLGLRLKDKRTGATCAYSQQQILIQ